VLRCRGGAAGLGTAVSDSRRRPVSACNVNSRRLRLGQQRTDDIRPVFIHQHLHQVVRQWMNDHRQVQVQVAFKPLNSCKYPSCLFYGAN
jgi:hypothetical protein